MTESTTVSAAGLDLNVRVEGPEGAPHVTMSHSLSADLHMWDPQADVLARDYRVLRFDTRGHGSSSVPPAPYSLDDLVGDVVALLDELGVEKTHFIGLSLGGMIAQGLALAHPDRVSSITIANSAAVTPDAADAMWEERIAAARERGMDALVDATIERWFTEPMRSPETPVVQRTRAQIKKTPVAGYIGCSQAIRGLRYAPRLAEIAAPTLLIAGDQDVATPPAAMREMHAVLPNSTYVELEAAHLSNLEQPALFTAALEEFLAA